MFHIAVNRTCQTILDKAVFVNFRVISAPSGEQAYVGTKVNLTSAFRCGIENGREPGEDRELLRAADELVCNGRLNLSRFNIYVSNESDQFVIRAQVPGTEVCTWAGGSRVAAITSVGVCAEDLEQYFGVVNPGQVPSLD